jgi:glutamate synthase (ferredoxin)
MFPVDMNEGRIIEDDEIKDAIVTKRPYRKWLDDNFIASSSTIPTITPTENIDFETRLRLFDILLKI